MRLIPVLAILSVLGPASARAEGTPPSQPWQPPASSPEISARTLTPRQQAEPYYADAWRDIERARRDLEEGKDRNAEKKFRRALERATRATELDSAWHEPWNLVGYTSRRLGEYDAALQAYARCLRIKPDFAQAREYMGQAFVELGRLDEARQQLVFLEQLEATDLARQLRASLEARRGAGADSAGTRRDSSAARSARGW